MHWRLDGRPAGDARRLHLTIDPRAQMAAAAFDDGIARLEGQQHLIDSSLQGALEVASAYSTRSNNGRRAVPHLTEAVEAGGARFTTTLPTLVRVAGEADSFVVLQMLRSVVGNSAPVAGATATNAKAMAGLSQFQLAGKTGTGQVSDLWFVGVSPQLVVVTWVGSDQNMALPLAEGWTGATAAHPIWASFVSQAMQERPELLAGEFQQPAGVVSMTIDPRGVCLSPSGLLNSSSKGEYPPRAPGSL
jgi:membrane peptidoglycan carboxypeptidase